MLYVWHSAWTYIDREKIVTNSYNPYAAVWHVKAGSSASLQGYNRVQVYAPESDVTVALMNNGYAMFTADGDGYNNLFAYGNEMMFGTSYGSSDDYVVMLDNESAMFMSFGGDDYLNMGYNDVAMATLVGTGSVHANLYYNDFAGISYGDAVVANIQGVGNGIFTVYGGGGGGNVSAWGNHGSVFIHLEGGDNDVDAMYNGTYTVINTGDGADRVNVAGDDGVAFVSTAGGDDIVTAQGKIDLYAWLGLGNDIGQGGAGDDQLFGEGGRDILSGGRGNDTIFGGDGNDALFGDQGADFLSGGRGADLLGVGVADVAIGGEGEDTFTFTSGHGENKGIVEIIDFNKGEGDMLDLEHAGISKSELFQGADGVFAHNADTGLDVLFAGVDMAGIKALEISSHQLG